MSIETLLRHHPVWDGHNDFLWEGRDQAGYDWGRLDIASDLTGRTHTDLARLRAGGVGAQFWSVYVPDGPHALAMTLEQIDGAHRLIERHPEALRLTLSADEVERAWRDGRIASLLGAEGGHSLDCSLGTLRCLYALGVRYVTLTHNDSNEWADSATGVARHDGLSDFGIAVVAEMNRLGMLVDLSHVAVSTMRAALDVSVAPVIFSHSSARALCDVPRNVPDNVLARLADNGGLCMVTFVPKFISARYADWADAAEAAARVEGLRVGEPGFADFMGQWAHRTPAPPISLAEVVAHVEHVRDVAGIDHVGLGGDYDGAFGFPDELADVSGYPRLLEALAQRHWSEADLARLTSGTMLRVLREAEATARELQRDHGPGLTRFSGRD